MTIEKTRSEILIRPIEAKDNQAVQKIVQDSLAKVGLDIPGTAYFDPELGTLFEHYQQEPKGEYWVVEDTKIKEVVGGIGIGTFGNYKKVAEIQKYYLIEEYQNQGIGRLLFEEAFAFCKEMDYDSIYLETMDKLFKANRVYEHYGFELMDAPLNGSEHGLMNRWYMKNI